MAFPAPIRWSRKTDTSATAPCCTAAGWAERLGRHERGDHGQRGDRRASIVAAAAFVKAGVEMPPRMLIAGMPAKGDPRPLSGRRCAGRARETATYQGSHPPQPGHDGRDRAARRRSSPDASASTCRTWCRWLNCAGGKAEADAGRHGHASRSAGDPGTPSRDRLEEAPALRRRRAADRRPGSAPPAGDEASGVRPSARRRCASTWRSDGTRPTVEFRHSRRARCPGQSLASSTSGNPGSRSSRRRSRGSAASAAGRRSSRTRWCCPGAGPARADSSRRIRGTGLRQALEVPCAHQVGVARRRTERRIRRHQGLEPRQLPEPFPTSASKAVIRSALGCENSPRRGRAEPCQNSALRRRSRILAASSPTARISRQRRSQPGAVGTRRFGATRPRYAADRKASAYSPSGGRRAR